MPTNSRLSPALIALIAMLIALTTVFTLVIRLPLPGSGYFNLSDVAVAFSAFTFGPWIGMITGGVGTALADLLGGYPQYAVFSLLAHGSEGLIIGLVAWRSRRLPVMVLAWLFGSLAMIAVYFLAEGLVLATWPVALADVPGNAIQAVAGLAGIPLVLAVRRAYPPIDRVGQARTWREE